MIRVLIPYGTTEGQTARISEYLADVIRDHGHEAYAVDIKGSGAPEPDDYDAAIVGASIHMRKHEDYVRDFVREAGVLWRRRHGQRQDLALPKRRAAQVPLQDPQRLQLALLQPTAEQRPEHDPDRDGRRVPGGASAAREPLDRPWGAGRRGDRLPRAREQERRASRHGTAGRDGEPRRAARTTQRDALQGRDHGDGS